jgi:hypothetical protein
MNPAVIAAVAEGSKLAVKGGKWGYDKWKKGRDEKKCIRTIIDALPDDTTLRDEREARCVAKVYCAGTSDIKVAESICHRGKKR